MLSVFNVNLFCAIVWGLSGSIWVLNFANKRTMFNFCMMVTSFILAIFYYFMFGAGK